MSVRISEANAIDADCLAKLGGSESAAKPGAVALREFAIDPEGHAFLQLPD